MRIKWTSVCKNLKVFKFSVVAHQYNLAEHRPLSEMAVRF